MDPHLIPLLDAAEVTAEARQLLLLRIARQQQQQSGSIQADQDLGTTTTTTAAAAAAAMPHHQDFPSSQPHYPPPAPLQFQTGATTTAAAPYYAAASQQPLAALSHNNNMNNSQLELELHLHQLLQDSMRQREEHIEGLQQHAPHGGQQTATAVEINRYLHPATATSGAPAPPHSSYLSTQHLGLSSTSYHPPPTTHKTLNDTGGGQPHASSQLDVATSYNKESHCHPPIKKKLKTMFHHHHPPSSLKSCFFPLPSVVASSSSNNKKGGGEGKMAAMKLSSYKKLWAKIRPTSLRKEVFSRKVSRGLVPIIKETAAVAAASEGGTTTAATVTCPSQYIRTHRSI